MKKYYLLIVCMLLSLSEAAAQRPSNLASRNYPPPVTNVTMESSNLPLVFITTNSVLGHDNRVMGHMTVVNNADGENYVDLNAHADQTLEFDGPIAIKWRGTSSFQGTAQTKKPMSIKTLEDTTKTVDGKKKKVSLLGMGKDNDWCFLAPWQDNSYIRDILTMQMARGGYAFAPEMRYCEVFFNNIYYGVFVLSERATKGKNRLNLWDYGLDEDDNPIDDTTGDFHVEVDRATDMLTGKEEPHYTSYYRPMKNNGDIIWSRRIIYQYKDPEYEDFVEGTQEAVDKAIADMEDAFAANDYEDRYGDYIDRESFMDFEIAQEVSNNVDAYRLSTPLYKYSDTHARATGDNNRWKTALWDFNIAYGHEDGYYFDPFREDWRYTANDMMMDYGRYNDEIIPFYWIKLNQDDAYINGIKARYTQRRLSSYTDRRIEAIKDSLLLILEQEAVERDHQAWRGHFSSLENAIAEVVDFTKNRLEWMDSKWFDAELVSDATLEGTTLWKDNAWFTLCLPFRLSSLDGTPLEGATVKTLISSSLDNGTLTLNFTDGKISSIEAGKPYLVKWKSGVEVENPTFKNMVLDEAASTKVETDYIDFVGTLSPITLRGGDQSVLYVGADNTLYYPAVDIPLNAYHAYFQLKNGLTAGGDGSQEAPIRSLVLNFDGEATGIFSIVAESSGQETIDVWYTLDGRRLSGEPSAKGIYIHNGRKIVKK